jgi:two-component system sensor histidine kinase TctE
MRADWIAHARESLRVQLLLWLVLPALAVLIVSSLASYFMAFRFASEAYDVGLYDGARSLAQQIQFDAHGRATLELPRAAEEILHSDPLDRIFFRVLLPSGATLAGRPDLPIPEKLPHPANPVSFYDAAVDGEPIRVSAYALFDEKGEPRVTVLVAETLMKRARLSRNIAVTMSLPLLTLILLMGGIAWIGVQRGLEPLQRVAEAVSQRGWNDLSPIGDQGVPREVRPLTHALDDLMSRLGLALGAQQRFIAEAAHQLRTPLAGITAQTERALLARDIETIRPALEQLRLASRRVSRLVNQLLSLARAEPGAEPARNFRPLDLSALVQRVCREWVPEAYAQNVDLGFEGEANPVMINGDELLLSEMLGNLIDNAVRYGARPGGRITVKLTATPSIAISVEDNGPGIPEEERSRIFERFHRVPGSSPGGTGLGLAIVREIARAHGASVSVQPAGPDGGTVFRIEFA